MTTRKRLSFEASARLQRLIGRGLIPNDEMAIVELVKNAYDSGAQRVTVLVQPDRQREPGLIRISDDGSGMSEDQVRRLFMFAGYSERPEQVASAKRVPTGEKGIGRFAADKLGRTLDVFTVRRGQSGIHLAIDWREFDVRGTEKFSDISAVLQARDVSGIIPGQSGTVLEIRHISSKWDTAQVERLRIWLDDLLDPFAAPKDFAIELDVGGTKRGALEIRPIRLSGDVSMDLRVEGDRVVRTVKVRGEKAALTDIPSGSSAELRSIQGLRARFIHFDRRPTKRLTGGLEPGVRVYRDGFRIEPFGSRASDWLGVTELRAKRAGHAHVVPSRLYGFVRISRQRNPQLDDTTSRQALMDTEAARNLVTVLREGLGTLAEVLRTRTEPRWKENRRKRQAELEQARLHTLAELASGLAHELRQPLQAIRSEADNIREWLSQRQILDPEMQEAQGSIDRGVERIDKNISLISGLTKGNLTDASSCDIAALAKEAASVISHRCAPLGILVDVKVPASLTARVNETVVTSVVVNFLKNAMDSIETSGGQTISITLRKSGGSYRFEVSDDGGGVPLEVEPKLFTRFATRKTGGMGFGLYYCKILVESHGGKIGYKARKRGATFWAELPESS